jgi:hypothetical protein
MPQIHHPRDPVLTPSQKTAPASRGVAKATFIGRLGGTPTVHQTANGKEFVRYSIATNRPPKRDDAGEMVKSEDGCKCSRRVAFDFWTLTSSPHHHFGLAHDLCVPPQRCRLHRQAPGRHPAER